MKLRKLFMLACVAWFASADVPCDDAKELVQWSTFPYDIKLENLQAHAERFSRITDLWGTRRAGSRGYNRTVDYVVEQLESLGDYYDIERQTYPQAIDILDGAVLGLDGIRSIIGKPFRYSKNATLEDRELIWISSYGCDGADFPPQVDNKIVLLGRGPQRENCTFASRSANAGAAGAVALIIFDHRFGAFPIDGVLSPEEPSEGPTIPTLSISQKDALSLRSSLESGPVNIKSFEILALTEIRYSENVLATTKQGESDSVIFVGAHLDSVKEGPGMNDNGSGSIGILEVARQLARYSTNITVTFAWWTAEEDGLLGSTYFVDTASAERFDSIKAYLNFDMIASGNGVIGVYDGDGDEFGVAGPAGSDDIEAEFHYFFQTLDLEAKPVEFNGRSDYAPFLDADIPCGGLFTGADGIKVQEEVEYFGGTTDEYDPNYHTFRDTISNWSYQLLELNTKAIAHAVGWYSSGFGSFSETRKASALRTRSKVARVGPCSVLAQDSGRFKTCNVA